MTPKFSQKVGYYVFINNRPAHRVVQGSTEIKHRTETIDIMVQLDFRVKKIKSGIKMHKIGRPKEITVNATLSEYDGEYYFFERRVRLFLRE